MASDKKETSSPSKTAASTNAAPKIVKPIPSNVMASPNQAKAAPKAPATNKTTTSAKRPAATTAAKKPAAPAKKASAAKSPAKSKSNVVSIAPASKNDAPHNLHEQLQEQFSQASAEHVQHMARSADIAARMFNESLSITRDHAEACTEAGNIAAHCAGELSESLMHYANDAMTQSVEISKRFFDCRSAGDVMELQSRLAQTNTDRFLAESTKLADMFIAMSTKACEPLTDSFSDATDRISRTFR